MAMLKSYYLKSQIENGSNQSLERTTLGLPDCMGLPWMVSLSSSRWVLLLTTRQAEDYKLQSNKET